MSTVKSIFVTGATGNQGGAVASRKWDRKKIQHGMALADLAKVYELSIFYILLLRVQI